MSENYKKNHSLFLEVQEALSTTHCHPDGTLMAMTGNSWDICESCNDKIVRPLAKRLGIETIEVRYVCL